MKCRYCRVEFEDDRSWIAYCEDHRDNAKYRMSVMRQEAVKQTGAKTQREAIAIKADEYAHMVHKCLDCGESLEGKRSNAFYCTNTCRMRYQRREQRLGILILSPRMRRNLRDAIRGCHGASSGLGKTRKPTYDKSFKVLSKERFHAICDGAATSLKTHEISELSRLYPGTLLALGIDA